MNALVTGGAGFIGSHIAERALQEGCHVRIIDNLSTGHTENMSSFLSRVDFMKADLLDDEARERAVKDVEVIFHEAAIASVPRSVVNPVESHLNGAYATVLLLDSARRSGVRRVVLAASSSSYGETKKSPKSESMYPDPISPYAATKLACEHYAAAFARCYDIDTVSLRYFNVFGPRQDPSSQYSGVIAKFCQAFTNDDPITVYGDGNQSRDFTYVSNVVAANWLAATTPTKLCGKAYNVGCGEAITLNQMLDVLRKITKKNPKVSYESEREGDVRHSVADISRIMDLGYYPQVWFDDGLKKTLEWY